MITITFIRHGESEDNLKSIWAGWKDAPLSDLGVNQALALAQFFSDTRFDVVYASPLLRAYATGERVRDAQPNPQPPLISNPKLREQHFGVAEGRPWCLRGPPNTSLKELIEAGIFPVLGGRSEKFPEAESLDDLARRAEEAILECIVPHLAQDGAHIAVASHGLCISELVAALLRLDPESRRDKSYSGLVNTGWTRVVVSIKDGHSDPIDPENLPPLDVRVTDVNRRDHLVAAKKAAAIVSEEQRKQRAFFGGGSESA